MSPAIEPSAPIPELLIVTGEPGTQEGETEIRIKGKDIVVPSVCIDGRTVITSGRWLKIAVARDEDLIEGKTVVDPKSFIRQLKASKLRADLFAFSQRLPDETPIHQYRFDWENVAAIPITTYSDWWEKKVDAGVRRAVRKATKAGVETKVAQLDDAFVEGIVRINNETPIRQGKPFWHYQKSFANVKKENSTYAERNIFLGAYWEGELIGYIRMTRVGSVGSLIQLLTMMKHFDKKPANALVAKAVEVCEQLGMSHLMYCNYIYNDPNSSLTEFKRRNGFQKVLLPRYYIPLTLKGHCALKLKLHRGIAQSMPKPLLLRLLKLRSRWYERKLKAVEEVAATEKTV